MRILAIETSCDETAVAVVEYDDSLEFKTLSNVVASQIDIHRQFGGVVPEVAARSHLEVILPIVEQSIADAHTSWNNIDAVAVTCGPGLLGALLIGVNTARTLAIAKNKPLVGIDHVHAHVYAAWLDKAKPQQPRFPILGLIVSGGHTQLVLFKDHLDYRLLGQTQDDAVGEAFDKVAKMLGLGFPGGPALSAAAKSGDSSTYKLPTPKLDGKYDFSFSGLKTAVLRHLQQLCGQDYNFPSHKLAPLLTSRQINDTAAAFQAAAVKILVGKTTLGVEEFNPRSIICAGGVAANQMLRETLRAKFGGKVLYPPLELCTDNAAMIAALGCIQFKKGMTADPLKLESQPSLSMQSPNIDHT